MGDGAQLEIFTTNKHVQAEDTGKIVINWYSAIYNMHMYWTKQKPEVIAHYIERYCQKGGTVLDAFCGSGMTGVAALLTGRKAILSDLSPLCEFLAKNFTTSCDLTKLKPEFFRIQKDLSEELDWLYHTDCHSCGNKNAKVNAVIWADDFECPKCGHEQNMCHEDSHLSLEKGDVIDTLKCKKCKHEYAKEMKYFSKSSPISIEVDCGKCKKNGKENSRKLKKADLEWIDRINEYKIRTFVPRDVKFPNGINTKRCFLRGITHPFQLFSKMNLIYLSKYWDAVTKSKLSDDSKDKLKFIATSSMFHASLMRRWLPYRSGVPLKGTLFVPSMSEDVRFDKVLTYQADRVFKGQELLNKLETKNRVVTRVESALKLNSIKNASVDYLYYDPPFGGHINYSELNVVWEAWLGTVTDSKEEVIVNRVQGKTMDDYSNLLCKAIEEGCRKLKIGGHFTIVFAHSDLKVWRVLQESTSRLPLEIVGSPEILDSANKTFIQLYSSRAQQSMITFTFQKKTGVEIKLLSNNFLEEASKEVGKFFRNNPSGVKREDLYDHMIRKLFSKVYFEEFDLDEYLKQNYKCTAGLWYEKSSRASKGAA